ncbi:P27 family phage terminase small subunit [Streptomyces sp. NPDC059875]|uniref:P27 family phage terminase small subunit n=1 Tax=unclassified Streptomyces TaxID=2593676 RepID=UPI003656CEE0
MTAKGVLTAWDVEAYANWCDAVARRRTAAEHVAQEGAVVEHPVYSKNGDVTGTRVGKNAWLLALDAADAQVQRYGARFGLTPSDRAQLKIGGQTDPAGAERRGVDAAAAVSCVRCSRVKSRRAGAISSASSRGGGLRRGRMDHRLAVHSRRGFRYCR